MRRRLDLAATLILAPAVLFLDEPTTGLDPRNRNEVWRAIRSLVAGGTTVLLTTQYLDEADQLADQIVVMDSGTAIASGTPEQLKAQVGGDQLEVVVRARRGAGGARRPSSDGSPAPSRTSTRPRGGSAPRWPTGGGPHRGGAALSDAGIGVADIALRRPTLDDVFLQPHRTQSRDARRGGGRMTATVPAPAGSGALGAAATPGSSPSATWPTGSASRS